MAERQAREANTADAYVNDSAAVQQPVAEPNGEGGSDGPVRRPLIRATLPAADGTPLQPTRRPPVFTMHQRTGRGNADRTDLPDNFGNTWEPPPTSQPARNAAQKQGGKPRRRNRFRSGQAGNGNGQPNGNVAGNREGRSHGGYRSRRNRGRSR